MEGAGGRNAAETGPEVLSIPRRTHRGLGTGTVPGCFPPSPWPLSQPRCWDTLPATGRERERLSWADVARSVWIFVPRTPSVIGLGCPCAGGGRSVRWIGRRGGRVLDLHASKGKRAGINKGKTSRDLEEQERLSERVIQLSPLNSAYHFRDVSFRKAAGSYLCRIPCLTLNKIFADEGLNEQRQIFRLPRDKLGVPPKGTFSIFSRLSCSSPAWQFCRERLAHLTLPPSLAFASCSLHSSVQLCSNLRHFLPASASSRAPQLTKLTKINSKRGILKGINFSLLFFPSHSFLEFFVL